MEGNYIAVLPSKVIIAVVNWPSLRRVEPTLFYGDIVRECKARNGARSISISNFEQDIRLSYYSVYLSATLKQDV